MTWQSETATFLKGESVRLTGREAEVLRYIARGYSCADVAEILFVSKRTVDFHLGNIYEKLKVKNRVQAILTGGQLGLIPAEFPFGELGAHDYAVAERATALSSRSL